MDISKKKPSFPISEPLKNYLQDYDRSESLPIKYEDLTNWYESAAIYDSKATIVRKDGKNALLYIWYDNEYGYSHQVIRLAKYIAKVRRFTYY